MSARIQPRVGDVMMSVVAMTGLAYALTETVHKPMPEFAVESDINQNGTIDENEVPVFMAKHINIDGDEDLSERELGEIANGVVQKFEDVGGANNTNSASNIRKAVSSVVEARQILGEMNKAKNK